MPIGLDAANWVIEPWGLSAEALPLLDEAFLWLMTGELTDRSALGYLRNALVDM